MEFSEEDKTDLNLQDLSSAVKVLSRKWHPLILYILNKKDEIGFNEIKEELDTVSGKVLSNSLKDLEEKQVIDKRIVSESPRRVKYSITEKGKELNPVLEELIDWNEKHSRKQSKILTVDDEKKLADIYQKWLQEEYNVDTAYSGEEALNKADDETDLVLLDRMMPEMSGQEVLEKIKENFEDVQVVMVTAKDPEIEIADLEIDDYLVKPVDKEELREKVAEILERKEDKKDLEALEARKKLLKNKFSEEELEETEAYKELISKIHREK